MKNSPQHTIWYQESAQPDSDGIWEASRSWELVAQLLQEFSENEAGQSGRWERWLQQLQIFLGSQGIGFFQRSEAGEAASEEWQCLLGLGGRSLGMPDSLWLSEVHTRQQASFRSDQPAVGWAQIAVPVALEAESSPAQLLLISGRHLASSQLMTAVFLAQLLQSLSAFEQVLEQGTAAKQEAARLLTLQNQLLNDLELETLFLSPFWLQEWRQTLGWQSMLVSHVEAGLQKWVGAPPENIELPAQPFSVQSWQDLLTDTAAESNRDWLFFPERRGDQETGNFLIGFPDPSWPVSPLALQWTDNLWNLACQHWRLRTAAENTAARQRQTWRSQQQDFPLIGNSAWTQSLRTRAAEWIQLPFPLLISGPVGAGKAHLAHFLHLQHPQPRPLSTLICYQLSSEHLQAAFLEARQSGGILLLKSLEHLAPEVQVELIRLLEENRESNAVSGPHPMRMMATTTVSLKNLGQLENFSSVLAMLFSVGAIEVPPLIERKEDLRPLGDYFLKQQGDQQAQPPLQLEEAAWEKLLHYSWPGNVQELKNLCERWAWTAQKRILTSYDLQLVSGLFRAEGTEQAAEGLAQATAEFQRHHIRQAIAQAQGNMTETARLLDLHRTNLYRKMRQLEMSEAQDQEA